MEHGFTSRYGFWFRCGCAAEKGHTYTGRVGVVCVARICLCMYSAQHSRGSGGMLP